MFPLYLIFPDVIQQRLCSCFLFFFLNLWMRELLKFQRALWFCFWWWEIIWVLINTKELILHDQTKKTSLLFINHSEFLSLIKDSDKDSERAENDTEQLMLLFSQNMWFNQFFARGCSINIHKPKSQIPKTKSIFPLKEHLHILFHFSSADAETSLTNTISLQSTHLCRPLIHRNIIQQSENK